MKRAEILKQLSEIRERYRAARKRLSELEDGYDCDCEASFCHCNPALDEPPASLESRHNAAFDEALWLYVQILELQESLNKCRRRAG